MIEIVEEISAVIRIENLQETANIARELRESIVATEPIVDINTGNIVHEINSEQLNLSHKLQKAISALLVQVYDSAQELAPGIGEEILQRVASVTAHLQANLVAVTGVNVAVQAPANFVVEEEELMDTLHKAPQIRTVVSTTDGVVESSETVVLENVEIVAPIEHANAALSVNEKVAVESLISHVQETTKGLDEVLPQGIDSLRVTHEIDAENSTRPVLEQMTLIEEKINNTAKESDAFNAVTNEELLVKSESNKIKPAEPEQQEIEESINLNGKFVFYALN